MIWCRCHPKRGYSATERQSGKFKGLLFRLWSCPINFAYGPVIYFEIIKKLPPLPPLNSETSLLRTLPIDQHHIMITTGTNNNFQMKVVNGLMNLLMFQNTKQQLKNLGFMKSFPKSEMSGHHSTTPLVSMAVFYTLDFLYAF